MHPSDQLDLAHSQMRLRQTIQELQERAAREKAAQKKTPLRCPTTIQEYRALTAEQIRELMSFPKHKSAIEAMFAAHNRKVAREVAKREEAESQLEDDMARQIGGDRGR